MDRDGRMLDLVLAVDDAEGWHAKNLAKNPAHYVWAMRQMGARAVARVQDSRFGARLYYNTLMPASRRHYKYGVITVDALLDDLQSWRHLYVAGRAHKPVRVLHEHAGLKAALDANVDHATAAALLTLEPRFSEEDLYVAAAALSYTGDVRMRLAAESCNKVPAIVQANMLRFRSLYAPAIARLGGVAPNGNVWSRDMSPQAQCELLRRLPLQLRTEIKCYLGVDKHANFDGVASTLASRSASYVSKAVVASVAAIVRRSSFQQTLKGLFTAGTTTSAKYAAAKMAKSLKSRLPASANMLLNNTYKV